MIVSTDVIARWVNSIAMGTPICCGITDPLQKGQCAPHPSPENEARTYAPHRITGMLYANTSQANFEYCLRVVSWSIYFLLFLSNATLRMAAILQTSVILPSITIRTASSNGFHSTAMSSWGSGCDAVGES